MPNGVIKDRSWRNCVSGLTAECGTHSSQLAPANILASLRPRKCWAGLMLCGGSNEPRGHAMVGAYRLALPVPVSGRSCSRPSALYWSRFLDFLGESVVTSLDSFKSAQDPHGGRQDLRLLQPGGGGEGRARRHLPPAVLAEGAAGEPAALRGRPHASRSTTSRRWRDWLKDKQLRPRDRLPPGARADAGLHRRAGGGRPRRHARRDGRRWAAIRRRSTRSSRSTWSSTTRCMVDDFGTARRLRAQRRARVRAQRRALRLPALGPDGLRQFPRGAARHRHLPPGEPRVPGAGRLDRTTRAARTVAYPDTLVGTDSHTTMVNGLAVLGWGVGGIEAEAAMLGQPISMLIPEVVGFKLTGKLPEGATATDLVLTVTQMLRKKGVVGKFVEFYGPGLDDLPLADRATIANMAPEYGATCGFFPIDAETLRLPAAHRPRRRSASRWSRPTPRRRACGATTSTPDPVFTDTLELDLAHGRAVARRPEAAAGPRAAARGGQGELREGADRDARRPTRRPRRRVAGQGHRLRPRRTATW